MANSVKEPKVIEIPQTISVRDLADTLGISPVELLKALIANGIMASITESVDYDTAAIIGEDLGFDLRLEGAAEREAEVAAEIAEYEAEQEQEEAPAEPEPPGIPWYLEDESADDLVTRPPVVTMMGHVDHGKTSLLDTIRDANVTAGESGGITQHTGAYTVQHNDQAITFIDTPGHEAFTAMRARGAQATDIAILVVAADDGVMPTTREAIDHTRAAGVPIIVAINKVDLPGVRPERVIEELSELGIVAEEWGGDTFFVRTSAETGAGLDELLEAILLTAEEHPPMANPRRMARGLVLEGNIDPSRGVIATLLVQSGVLKRGDNLVIEGQAARVRAMFDHTGEPLKEAGPSTPVEIMGLSDVPDAGARFEVQKSAKTAKSLAAKQERDIEEAEKRQVDRPMTLEELFARASAGEVKSLNLVVKSDFQGTLQPVVDSLEKLSGDEVKVTILHAATGDITESDVALAAASDAVVIGFRVSPDPRARREAASKRVEIREYDVIYKLAEDVEDILEGMLDPIFEERTIARAEVKQVFGIPRIGKIAGCAVVEGTFRRNAQARVLRDGEQIVRTSVSSLKRFQDDVREVREGFECGIGLEGFQRFEEGDVIEAFVRERVR